MAITIEMPQVSDTMEEGVLLAWLVEEGEEVSPGDVIAQLETDKATADLVTFYGGVILKKMVNEGDVVPVRQAIAILDEKGEDASPHRSSYPGYVYVLANPSYRRNVVKIGMTTRDPEERARELSQSTGVPQPFVVAFKARVPDCREAERRIHDQLMENRVNSSREFFEIDVQKAVSVVKQEVLRQVSGT